MLLEVLFPAAPKREDPGGARAPLAVRCSSAADVARARIRPSYHVGRAPPALTGVRAGMRNNRYGDREVVPYVMCVDAVSALHGQIEEGVLANLLQYLSLSQATGCLTLRHLDRRQGNVFLERGRVVFVDAKPLYDIVALSTLMRWEEGRFSYRTGVQALRRTLKDSTETLLLEASYQTDVEDRVGV